MRRDVVILACAISAGIHGALVPAHLDESAAAGWAFAVSTAILAALASALTRRPRRPPAARPRGGDARRPARRYALAVTTGLPLLHPEPEPVDGLAVATKAIEAAGLVTAWSLLRGERAVALATPRRKESDMDSTRTTRPIPLFLTALVAFFSALAALAVSNGHDAMAHGSEPHHGAAG